jgi:hypothetical protein
VIARDCQKYCPPTSLAAGSHEIFSGIAKNSVWNGLVDGSIYIEAFKERSMTRADGNLIVRSCSRGRHRRPLHQFGQEDQYRTMILMLLRRAGGDALPDGTFAWEG